MERMVDQCRTTWQVTLTAVLISWTYMTWTASSLPVPATRPGKQPDKTVTLSDGMALFIALSFCHPDVNKRLPEHTPLFRELSAVYRGGNDDNDDDNDGKVIKSSSRISANLAQQAHNYLIIWSKTWS
ncbi:hypothetical protein ElyMa_003106100 [Elysia marginata]|uniref:Uncharacterized protein n=1 Tax=Elysia marginata TaxID=1093978 RepID=A0AAV4INM6_9GAST|nr:hypothetical protein ElyMa_003106100 [Elysia marginata]